MPLRILLADDEPSNREVASIMIESLGHRVTLCADGLEVLDRCLDRDEPFDVIMLDMQMPGMDGLQVARRLRADDRTRHVPIVGLSARARDEDRAEALAAGCGLYLTKPYRRHQLVEILRALALEG